MILIDTSVWIDHLHRSDARLAALLERDEAVCHPLIIEELAMGSISRRVEVLDSLAQLRQMPVLTHGEILEFVEVRQLWGRGLSPVDVHLLGSALVTRGAGLWTADKSLARAASEVGVAHAP